MGWYRRGTKRYYFRSKRVGTAVKKIYFGRGRVAELAARADALKRHEIEEVRQNWKQIRDLIDDACHAFNKLDSGCELLRDAVLLSEGFHRPGLHKWRKWHHGRRIIKELG